MKKSDYLPYIRHVVEIVDRRKSELSIDEVRSLNKVKNWLREKDEAPLLSRKVNREVHSCKARGITI